MGDFIVTEYNFISKKVTRPVHIAMLADLHNQQYGKNNEKLLCAIREKNVDMILLAGDMLVCHSNAGEKNCRTAKLLVKMADIAPVFYGIGNHEKGVMEEIRGTQGLWTSYKKVWKDCPDIHFLQNEKFILTDFNICLYGLDLELDYYTRLYKKKLHPSKLTEKLGDSCASYYNILLAHNPDYFRTYTTWKPDLIVSGHNHGGMIRLGRLGGLVSPRLHPLPKYDYGIYENVDRTVRMIVTSGCGMHSIPLRINNPAELCILHIQNQHPLLK